MSGQNQLLMPGAMPPANALAQAPDPYDWTERYNTQLAPPEEAQFQAWAAANGRARDLYDYDMRGFWQSGAQLDDRGHGVDRFKKPNHPTFSNESQYHGVDGYQGGMWGPDSFTPSAHNLQMMSPPALQQYFDQREPNHRLVLPR